MYRLFIWSTAQPHNNAQGVMDFWTKENAIKAYRFFFDLAMTGDEKITCMELYRVGEQDEVEDMSEYSACFPL